MLFEEKHKIMSIWRHASICLRSWFLALPSYQAFKTRLTRLSDIFPRLAKYFLSKVDRDSSEEISLVGLLHIMLCNTIRKAKPGRREVARDIFDKCYCSTKDILYYDLKLHALTKHAPDALPVPEFVGLTPASTHNLTATRPILLKLAGKVLFGDKIYADQPKKLQKQQDNFIYTPVKLIEDRSGQERQRNKAGDDPFSKAVLTIIGTPLGQPIDSLFNWFIKKTNLQNGLKIRSKADLYVSCV